MRCCQLNLRYLVTVANTQFDAQFLREVVRASEYILSSHERYWSVTPLHVETGSTGRLFMIITMNYKNLKAVSDRADIRLETSQIACDRLKAASIRTKKAVSKRS